MAQIKFQAEVRCRCRDKTYIFKSNELCIEKKVVRRAFIPQKFAAAAEVCEVRKCRRSPLCVILCMLMLK